ncbi:MULTISPECIES: hypothetical protein [unclassified Ketobacter]|uniref:hypothetical protein n=1 Tax=unclassified Ketobacter TaxID=2639109 RepID=UPI0025B87E41|nr:MULTISPECIES: hypothetical protein [unclassified Ketobacter]MCK5791506.1 hypothetical protein [Ketobacter sp.]
MLWRCLLWFGCLCLLGPGIAPAQPSLPEPLQPWQNWALKDHPDIDCPFSPAAFDQRQCRWPATLYLNVTATGLHFEQQWQLFRRGQVPLPGGEGYWPESVLVNAISGLVLDQGGRPAIQLEPGKHNIAGFIPWQRIPESILLPPSAALVSLKIDDRLIPPNIDAEGRLWFSARVSRPEQAEQASEDKLTVRVYRRLVDEIPFVMETRVDLEVAGKAREVVLGKILFDAFTPRAIHSPLPARVDGDGRLRMQLRAGQWQVQLLAHHNGPVEKVFFETSEEGFWPEEEIWVFEARPALRQVRVEGAEGLDPSQTALPQRWQQWPAYHVRQGQVISLMELRRGDPQPAPNQLNINRDLWLDFNGTGLTARDHIQGSMNRGWRLQVDPGQQLGSLTLNGDPQVITVSDGVQGVEVRQNHLQAQALSRLMLKPGTHKQRLPAVGWLHDMDRVSATLHIPPGWRVLMAAGMERSTNTWVDSWNVWDVFIVLITVAAMLKLRGLWSGVITGASLLLIYPEATLFLYLLLNVIAVMALLFVLPTGRLKKLFTLYGTASALLLVLWLLSFMVQQARLGLYPQLAQPWNQMGSGPVAEHSLPFSQQDDMASGMDKMENLARSVAEPAAVLPAVAPRERLEQRDPNLAAQTGPGQPNWQWERTILHWAGPVTAGETITLWLLAPMENRILCWLRVLLSVLVIAALFGLSRRAGQWQWSLWRAPLSSSALALVVMVLLLPTTRQAHAEFPDQNLLRELAQYQLQRQDCTPACLSIVRTVLVSEATRVTAHFTLNAQQAVYWTLPDSQKQWRVDSVLLNGEPHSATWSGDQSGRMLVFVPAGDHRVSVSGNLESLKAFQLTFGVQPHNIEVNSQDFIVQGLDNGRLLSNTLYLHPVDSARQAVSSEPSQITPDPMAAFVTVQRTLRLGRNWYMETRVQRVAPLDGGINLDIPLIAGESVTSRDVEVESGRARVVLRPGEKQLTWFSSLEKTSMLTLSAEATAHWAEQWQVEVSPLWHLEYEGLAPAKEGTSGAGWQPRWYPYPGEGLTLKITRPEAMAGATKTIDQVKQVWEPGVRESRGNLRLHVLTSKGSEQRIELPQDARVKSVKVNEELRAVDEQNPLLIVPLNPGQHWIDVEWRQPQGILWQNPSPVVDINDDYVNHQLRVNVPRNRWVLFVGGPDMGPAILFWGVLLVLVLVGFVLGRFQGLPLRSWHWIVLMVGLCAGWVETIVPVVAWFFLLHQRRQPWVKKLNRVQFNALQAVIVLLSLTTLAALLAAVPKGLIGSPDMGVTGNASSQYALNWFVDRGTGALRSAWFVSVPIWIYRLLMLVWSLWLVVHILRWLQWGWMAFTDGGYWRSGVVLDNADQEPGMKGK